MSVKPEFDGRPEPPVVDGLIGHEYTLFSGVEAPQA